MSDTSACPLEPAFSRDALAFAGTRGDNGGMPSWGSYSYAFGPIVAVVVLVVLVLILRWAFSRGQSVVAPPPKPGPPTDYGMLVAVAEPSTEQAARAVEASLREAGIRCSVTRTTEGLRVMVWPADAARAEGVLRAQPGA